MKRLWAPWRMAWIGADKGTLPAGCLFCEAWRTDDDRRLLVLERTARAFLILNAYPYASGHVMAVLERHVATVGEASVDELAEAMRLVQRAVAAIGAEYRPDGYNIGLNQGRAAGAGIADHLHIHVLPRWSGDTNFMTTVGESRVIPEALEVTYEKLRQKF